LYNEEIQKSGPPTGTKLIKADDLKEWLFEVEVLGESVYQGETFAMRFRFTDNYPLEAPEVVFVTTSPYKSPVVSRTSDVRGEKLLSQPLDDATAPTYLFKWPLLRLHLVDRVESGAQCQQCSSDDAEYAGELQGG
jgi:hypothetical protein